MALATETVGCDDTVTVVVFELEHEALVALIVYIVVTVGETEIELVFAPVFHV